MDTDRYLERVQILREAGLLQQLTGWQTLYLLDCVATDLLRPTARGILARTVQVN